MKIPLRSNTTTQGRHMAGARSLWRANGMREEQMGKPLIAVVNSFTQFVPGHAHLHQIGQDIKRRIEKEGCFAAEFNTIAIDDGIAMGHDGMLYSLPSRELIADSVEYMINAHKADAMICISNCDKITPGMLMAAMRLNIPTVFVSGGPMEAGRYKKQPINLVDSMIMAADSSISEQHLLEIEQNACPTCGSCSGMFTANSMNSLNEALGLALPGNGTVVATHTMRKELFNDAAEMVVKLAYQYYRDGNKSILPQSIATKRAFMNAMALDIAMGGSTNTVLHLLAIAHEAKVEFTMQDIDALSRKIPVLCKVAPNHKEYHIEDVNRAGGILGILAELHRGGVIDSSVGRIDYPTLGDAITHYDITSESCLPKAKKLYSCAPGGYPNLVISSQSASYSSFDLNRKEGCIRSIAHPYSKDGGLAVLYGNIASEGSIVKTAGVDPSIFKFTGVAKIYESQEEACDAILSDRVKEGDVLFIRYEGPKGGPGMQEMLYPTSYLKSKNLGKKCALVTDGRFSGGTSGLSIGHLSPEAAAGGTIAIVEEGDVVEIDIPNRTINIVVNNEVIRERLEREKAKGVEAFKPKQRDRTLTKALRAYATMVSSANRGAIRILPDEIS